MIMMRMTITMMNNDKTISYIKWWEIKDEKNY